MAYDYTASTGLLNSGNLQGAYNSLRDQNMTDDQIASWYNGLGRNDGGVSASDLTKNFGSNYTGTAVGGSTPGTPNAPYSAPKPYEAPQVTNDPSKGDMGTIFTNKPNTGLNADGSLQDGYQYATYSNGVGQGTPIKTGSAGVGGQTMQAPSAAPAQTGNVVVGGTAPPAPTGLLNTPPATTTTQAGGGPNINQAIDPNTMTIEGRVNNLLSKNSPTIRQAGERALAMFAQRGLLNSSMAQEAAMEAMTTKAIEIAGPDAAATVKMAMQNQDWTNKLFQDEAGYLRGRSDKGLDFEQKTALMTLENTLKNSGVSQENVSKLQTNYISAVDGINNNYSTMVNAINTSDMDLPQKEAAINNAKVSRTNAISFTNAAFERLPGWSKDWLIVESPTTQATPTTATPTPEPAPTPSKNQPVETMN
jgi:hypothetical protein